MVNDDPTWRKLKTVGTTLDVIEALADLDGAGVTELAETVGISKSSAHSHLSTLHEAGYLRKDDSEYALSCQFLLLGEYVRNANPLYQFGSLKADRLATETGHYVHLFTEENGRGVTIYEARGEHAGGYEYQSLKLQQREPLHVTASGKAILANLPERRVREIVDSHGLERYTENTITESEALFEELAEISEQGYAVNDEEEIYGFRAVAAPVRTQARELLGSISLSGPVTFLSDETFTDEMPERVIEAAEMIRVDANMSQFSGTG